LMVGGFTNDSEYRLAWEGAERDPFIHHYEIQLDERGWADVGMNHSYQLSLDDVDEGDHVFHVKAVDKAGN
ncbi:MAG: hypothetical protein GWO20_06390, partial [Candidatus Korarchaeota archaeon]|nr:hypothetical protein [Candidatus Korarchaeota archaeon]NIU85297.1 hypothetical protein [Candidatus Thorarchaeota archaeon]NIW15396.1 hypothetical protein [Candidatus Thorarchaeota archaeon]NIW53341.1 hypothetical protein [Candidatus Korarchaeota archaeon]